MSSNTLNQPIIGANSPWKAHPHHQNIFIHQLTQEQVQQHTLPFNQMQIHKFEKRLEEDYQFIVRLRHIDYPQPSSQTKQQKIIIFTDRLLQVNRSCWVPFNTPLCILKGFRRLSSIYGWMRVSGNMVGMNEKGQIRIWVNDHATINEPKERAINEQQMLKDIVNIIGRYDAETSILLKESRTINSAINSIFSRNTPISPLSSQNISKKTSFTKQEIYDYPSRYKTQQFDLIPKQKQVSIQNLQQRMNKLVSQSKPQINAENSQKENEEEKQSQANQIEGKNSYFTFMGSKRYSIPLPHLSDSKADLSLKNSSTFFRPNTSNLVDLLQKNVDLQSQRFSQLSLQEEVVDKTYSLKTLNDRYKTEEFVNGQQKAVEENRRQVEFLNIFEEQNNCLKQSNREQEKQQIGESGNFKKKEVKKNIEGKVKTKGKQQKKVELAEKKGNEMLGSDSFEEKKTNKQEFSKKIKKEFQFLFDADSQNNREYSKTFANTKSSSKDLLIRQKVQKKKATFAQLKSQAMKILSDDVF